MSQSQDHSSIQGLPMASQVVLITGAAGGLAPSVIQGFFRTGASLVLTDRNPDKLAALRTTLALDPARCRVLAADLTSLSDTARLVAEIHSQLGRLDVLVHLAGGFRMAPVHETSTEDWNFLFDLNVRSVLHLAHAIVPGMRARRQGCLLHVGSRAALQGAAQVGAYSAAKAAVVRLTESLAAELSSDGIRANCVLPGTIDTPQNRAAMPAADFARWVDPTSIAEVLVFLASPAARDITGAAIPVFGK